MVEIHNVIRVADPTVCTRSFLLYVSDVLYVALSHLIVSALTVVLVLLIVGPIIGSYLVSIFSCHTYSTSVLITVPQGKSLVHHLNACEASVARSQGTVQKIRATYMSVGLSVLPQPMPSPHYADRMFLRSKELVPQHHLTSSMLLCSKTVTQPVELCQARNLGGIRTPDQGGRSSPLCPLSYQAVVGPLGLEPR